MQEQRAGERRARRREAPRRRLLARRRGAAAARPRRRPPGRASSAACRAAVAPGQQLGVLVEQQRVAARARAAAASCRSRALPRRCSLRDQPRRPPGASRAARPSRRARRCRARAPRSRTAARRARARSRRGSAASSSRCSVLTMQKETSTRMTDRRPLTPAAGPPLCRCCPAAAPCASTSSTPRPTRRPTTTRCARRWRARAPTVALVTSRFAYGDGAAAPDGYRRSERFYRCAPGAAGARRAARGQARPARPRHAALPPRRARRADVVHFQWLTRPARSTRHLLPALARPLVLTAHDVLPARAAPGPARRPAAAVRARRRGRRPLRARRARAWSTSSGVDAGARPRDPARRASTHLAELPERARRCRADLAAVEGPVVLLLRPAAPLQGPRRAARGLARGSTDAELWIVGHAAHGHPRAARRRAAGRALRRRASSPTRRSPRCFRARRPRRAALPRDRPVGRALHRAGLRHSRCCSATSAASPRSPDGRGAARRRPATRPRCTPRSRGCSPTPARRAALAARGARAARRPARTSWEAIAAAPRSRSTRATWPARECAAVRRRAEIRLLGLRRACSSTPQVGYAARCSRCPGAALGARAGARAAALARAAAASR